jgi:hypothetical protein
MNLELNQWAAIKWLQKVTQNSFDLSMLVGPHMSSTRQALMVHLGGNKVPKSQCGINSVRSALYRLANVPEDTLAGKERHFANWARSVAD